MTTKKRVDTRHTIGMSNDDMFSLLSRESKQRGISIEKVMERYVNAATQDKYRFLEEMFHRMRLEFTILIDRDGQELEPANVMFDAWWTYMINMSRGDFDIQAVTKLLYDNIELVKSKKDKETEGVDNDR